jgi:hypothetical protein
LRQFKRFCNKYFGMIPMAQGHEEFLITGYTD